MPEIPGRLITHPITYCTNVHRGESWAETFAALREHVPAIKATVSPDAAFPIGLRLSRRAVDELAASERECFAAWLHSHDCFIPTLNGFPYGAFHGERIKERVYLPDWRSPDRAAYTTLLADLLATWLPHGMTGSISSVPIGVKSAISAADLPLVQKQLMVVLRHLHALQCERGKTIVLALEPEPGCVLETTEDVCNFLSRLDLPSPLESFIGICYDCCHQAVEFEGATSSLAKLFAAGVRIAKLQVSSALVIDGAEAGMLDRFDDSCYLHQVVVRARDGSLRRYDDIGTARKKHRTMPGDEWRCHFHLPIFMGNVGVCGTTRGFIEEALPLVPADLLLEIETYTWDVLPPLHRHGSLQAAIIHEIEWLKSALATRRPT